MLRILRRIDDQAFVPNHEIAIGNDRYFIDFYCSSACLGIECHSFRWHMGRHVADVRRDRRIRAVGIELLYFTWDDVCFNERDVTEEIKAAVARRLGSSQQKLPLER